MITTLDCITHTAMSTDIKNLYVVVHHRQDPDQRWTNSWLDDERLQAITTTAEIGRLCAEAKTRGEPVFVHRCGWSDSLPSISCSATVIQSAPIDKRTSIVSFAGQQVIGATPPVSPHPGQNYYRA